MAQPFGVGDAVAGRYRITHHVVTSADQDIVFQGVDQVLHREVNILLAAKSNAKQVATSAKELSTGERDSGVQVLDLGLAGDRTYLISSLIDPNQLLDLVVPDTAPYVEPFFTDSLGSELFGQSRIMEPETHADDAEYYARLHGLSPTEGEDDAGSRYRRRRPAFLDKVSDSLNKRLGTERDAERIAGPSAGTDAVDAGTSTTDTSTTGTSTTDAPEAETAAEPPTADSSTANSSQPASPRAGSPESAAAETPAASAAEQPESVQPDTLQPGPAHSTTARPTPARTQQSRPVQPRRPRAPFPIPLPPGAQPPAGSGSDAAKLNVPPTLADLQLVDSSAVADTEDWFGVEADDAGTYRPTGSISFSGATGPEVGSHHGEAGPSSEETDVPASDADSAADHVAEGEEVVDDPPSAPVATYDRRPGQTLGEDPAPGENLRAAASSEFPEGPAPAAEERQQSLPAAQPDSFTGLITAVPTDTRRAFPAAAGTGVRSQNTTEDDTFEHDDVDFRSQQPGPWRWLAVALLAALVLAAAVVAFLFLGNAG